ALQGAEPRYCRGGCPGVGHHVHAREKTLPAFGSKAGGAEQTICSGKGSCPRRDQAEAMMRSPTLKLAGFALCLGMPLLMPLGIREGSHAQAQRSEEHTSELQSLRHLVCRL